MKLKTILSECWTGYVQRGMKNKGGRQVPNCIPESINELTYNEKQIKTGKPENIYYAFYKGQFAADYSAMGPHPVQLYYKDKFKVRKPKGSQFNFNPDFKVISKKEYDKYPNHYAELKPYVDKFWDKLQNESVNEGRNVKSVQKDLDKVLDNIQSALAQYKSHKGTDGEKKHIENLKKLNTLKKKLESELDSAVSGLYRDAELKIED